MTHPADEALLRHAVKYAEIFSRTNRAGWDSWGNEVGKFGRVDLCA